MWNYQQLGTQSVQTNALPSTHPVGLKLQNSWGLYDMLGNVGEWCADVYQSYAPGGFRDEEELIPAALLYDHINASSVEHNLFDDPGTFWFFDRNAGNNDMRIPSYRKTVAIHIIGDENRITGNTILHSSDASIVVEGDKNVLMNNIADGNVRIRGRGNIVVNQVFTSPEARLMLEGEAAESTTVVGVPDGRIIRL
jgi:parallel beta-helix repeat protein